MPSLIEVYRSLGENVRGEVGRLIRGDEEARFAAACELGQFGYSREAVFFMESRLENELDHPRVLLALLFAIDGLTDTLWSEERSPWNTGRECRGEIAAKDLLHRFGTQRAHAASLFLEIGGHYLRNIIKVPPSAAAAEALCAIGDIDESLARECAGKIGQLYDLDASRAREIVSALWRTGSRGRMLALEVVDKGCPVFSEAFIDCFPQHALDWCTETLTRPPLMQGVKVTMIDRLASNHAETLQGRWEPCVERLLQNLDGPYGKEILSILSRISQPSVWKPHVIEIVKSRIHRASKLAFELLRQHGDRMDVEHVIPHISRKPFGPTAFRVAVELDPERKAEFAARFLLSDWHHKDDEAKSMAQNVLRGLPAETLVRGIPVWQGMVEDPRKPTSLLWLAYEAFPQHSRELIEFAAFNASWKGSESPPGDWLCWYELQRWAVARLRAECPNDGKDGPEWAVRIATHLSRGPDPVIRSRALPVLADLLPRAALQNAIKSLSDPTEVVIRSAVRIIRFQGTPEAFGALVDATRHPSESVRLEALDQLACCDDPRALAEVLSSSRDVDEDVRRYAERILSDSSGLYSCLRHLPPNSSQPAWQEIRERIEQIGAWAKELGQQHLGSDVIMLPYRDGLGRTRRPQRGGVIEIEVSDTPITRCHPQGEDVVRGLVLHEIGHHMFDIGVRGFSTTRGIARSEGVGQVFDVLRDARLERRLRGVEPAWAAYLDRLNSYVFHRDEVQLTVEQYAELLEKPAADVFAQVHAGALPGRPGESSSQGSLGTVRLSPQEQFALPRLVPPLSAFLCCLVAGFDPRAYPDPAVARAMKEVPANLKDLNHAELLEVARRVGKQIGKWERHKRDFARLRQRIQRYEQLLSSLGETLRRFRELMRLPIPTSQSGEPKEEPARDRGRRDTGTRPSSRTPGWDGGSRPRPIHRMLRRAGTRSTIDPLNHEKTLQFDPEQHAAIAGSIRRHIRRMRAYFERLGVRRVVERPVRSGSRLDVAEARKTAYRPVTRLLIREREEQGANLYLGVVIDRSRSMSGEKIERAKQFGILLAESARGLRGIEGHINAFDDDTWYVLGDFRRCTVASLESGGGTNDAAALARAAELALASRKQRKILIMISDGLSDHELMKDLVERLVREEGIDCVQVAVDRLEWIAFPKFVDLSQYSMNEAVARFGTLLVNLTKS